MSPEQVVAALRQLRYSPVAGRRLGLAYIASRAGVTTETLYAAVNSGRISPETAAKVGPILQGIRTRSEPQRAMTVRSRYFGNILAGG